MNKIQLLILLLIIITIALIVVRKNSITEKFCGDAMVVVPPKYFIGLMAIFKNENMYLKEWLDRHIAQGITRFYLYCNDPDLSKYDFLRDYDDDTVVLIDWVDKKNNGEYTIQRQAYQDCVKRYGKECQYLMMLDIDEFLMPSNKSVTTPIANMVLELHNENNGNVKAFKVQRYDFGSSGHISRPTGDVVDNYTKREKICSNYKTMANTEYLSDDNFYGVHDFPYNNKDGKVYNPYFDYKYKGYPNGCTVDDINELPFVIHHYYTKSYDEYITRCEMWKDGGVNNVGYRKDCEKLFKERDCNDVTV